MILPGFPMPLIMGKSGFDPNTPFGTFVEEEGGYYIAVINDGGQDFALFTPPIATGQNDWLQWKTSLSLSPGTSSDTNGLANCDAMNDAQHQAAQWARSRVLYGFNDYYLPSRDELNAIYLNRNAITGIDAFGSPTVFYWSSTEADVNYAYGQWFVDGNRTQGFKITSSYRTRVVRRVAI